MEKNKRSIKFEISKLVFEIFIGFLLSSIVFLAVTLVLYAFNIVVSRNMGSGFSQTDVSILKQSHTIEKDIKKYPFDYMIFEDGSIVSKHIPNDEIQFAQEAINQKKNINANGAEFLYISNTKNKSLVIRIPDKPEFTNWKLRRIFSFNDLTFLIFVAEFALVSIIAIAHFVFKMKKEFSKIENIISIIDAHSLDFPETYSKIKEFDTIITALQGMSRSLKNSIQTERKQKEILKFQVATLSHDIKTPLTIIRGNSDLLNLNVTDNEDKECIAYITEGTKTIEGYIDAMIQYTSLLNNAGFNRTEIAISYLCEEITKEVNGYITGKNIKFVVKYKKENEYIFGDRLAIKRALLNICVNACDYSSEDRGIVEMTVNKEPSKVLFIIWNNGQSFTDKAICKAGELFYRDSKRRNSTTHYGLGLPYAKEVARQHDGELILSNPSKGGAMVVLEIHSGN